jgi:hypothetical protein
MLPSLMRNVYPPFAKAIFDIHRSPLPGLALSGHASGLSAGSKGKDVIDLENSCGWGRKGLS